MRARIVAIAVLVMASFGGARCAEAFTRDTHYYLTFALSLATCFDWDEAHVIASADLMTDHNQSTTAEMNPLKKRNKRDWHAFGHSRERYLELWQRVATEPDTRLRLVKLGQLMHFIQDWEGHARFPVGTGHALATIRGDDPDSMARDRARTVRAAQVTVDHLAAACFDLGRLPADVEYPDEALPELTRLLSRDHLVRDLIVESSPDWRKRMKGGLTREGRQIMAANIRRSEEFVERQLASQPGKAVPSDFRPGSDEHGIPEPLELAYDRDGNLLSDPGWMAAAAGEQPADDDQEPGDDSVEVRHAHREEGGWQVRLVVRNRGDEPVPGGEVVLLAVEPFTEELLGEVTRPVPRLRPGRDVALEAFIPTSGGAEIVLLGVSVQVEGEHDLFNNQLWFMTRDDREELEEHLEAAAEVPAVPPKVEIEFVGPPRAWTTDLGDLCVALNVSGTTDDLTADLESPRITLVSRAGVMTELESMLPRVWTLSPTPAGDRITVKTFACFEATRQLCALMAAEDPPAELLITAETATFQRTTEVAIADQLAAVEQAGCTPLR